MDFIEQLPSSSSFTAILVVIDRLSKQAIFIPTHDTITSPKLAQLFLLHVFTKHGVPAHVTSDQGSEFVSHFFRSLGKALDMKLHFTSGYHPEGDGQTERANQTLKQYLRMYCNYQQDNWSDLLPLAKFAYNNAPSTTTGVSPFFANKGYHPNLTVHPKHDLSSAQAREYAVDLESLHEYLCEEMGAAQKRYQGPADTRRSPAPDFKVGDQVFVKAKYFRSTRPSKNLSEKNLGPYPIIAQVGTLSFTICLPDSMNAVHPVFHVSQLKPATLNTIPNRSQPPPPPIKVDGEPEFEITGILDSKFDHHQRQCPILYLVRWAGYKGTNKETSWLIATELGHANYLLGLAISVLVSHLFILPICLVRLLLLLALLGLHLALALQVLRVCNPLHLPGNTLYLLTELGQLPGVAVDRRNDFPELAVQDQRNWVWPTRWPSHREPPHCHLYLFGACGIGDHLLRPLPLFASPR